ncbi:hypothetical protein DH2020_020242 [Rehmannia glutinosa]|uniref:Formin-like protein n=1 Tax=Rehmannia glutinosa TaxID=99300 RepID=A0ABR0WHQ5_REHGL
MHHLHLLFTIFTFLLLSTAATTNHRHRRLLHQPFFPLDQSLPPTISQPPFSSPSPQPQPQNPKYPFSTLSPPQATTQNPFFPFFPSPPPPPSPPSSTTAFATFPANISSLVLPSSSHTSHKPIKLISLIVSVSLFSILVFASLVLLLLRHRHHHNHHQSLKSDSLRLFPPNTTPSDTTTADNSKKPPPPLFPRHTPSATSSEFLYLGTLVSSRDADYVAPTAAVNDAKAPPPAAAPMSYQRLGSPELQPLPPLPRQQTDQDYHNTHASASEGEENDNEEDEEEFFSPRGSTVNNASPYRAKLSPPRNNNGNDFNKTGILNSLNCNSPAYSISPDNSPSVVLNTGSPQSILTKSPDSLVSFPAPLPRFIPPPPAREPRVFSPFSPSSTEDGGTRDCSPRASDFSGVGKVPPTPPPPPPPPARFWETAPPTGPPELVAPSRKVVLQNVNGEKGSLGNSETKSEEMIKPKLKPLHWDKVRASSDRAMVWDQLKSSSFQLNEEMIETLFTVNSTVNAKDGVRRQTIPENQENLVLDPKKSQNIAILLRALNVTVDEVCEALVEGNADTLGTELLESLLKMAPTKEEERKLKEFKDESPFKLGTAEAFLKAVLSIPFAFKRVDAMLYIANFESEIEHLKRSFDTLEFCLANLFPRTQLKGPLSKFIFQEAASLVSRYPQCWIGNKLSACKELKSSRMFQKLLEAVLKTGNRMNIGTNRGDAHAFKLGTLLKLVDVKGADGKTTLLHFVVQEIIKAEGARLSGVNQNPIQQSTLRDEVEFKKLGLQVVSGLSGELTNVKKAAAMDADVLRNDVKKLAVGISKIGEVLKLNEEIRSDSCTKFLDNMNEFLKRAEKDIANIQAQAGVALSMVKGLTEYFHGGSGKEEARPLRLFMVVRDFLSILDRVCKDVGKINERTMINSGRQIQTPINASVPQVFPGFNERQLFSSSDDESSSSSSQVN